MQIKILTEGGAMKPNPALSQKLGPAGININQVIQKVNEATKNFEGLKVPIELDVNPITKEFIVKVFSPPVSELIKREIKIEKGSGAQKKLYAGNIAIEQAISVAKTKMPNMLSKDLKAALKSVVGTCVSLGVLVECKSPAEVSQEISQGKYDKEIKEEKTHLSPEKKSQLEKTFAQIKSKQEEAMKQEEAAKQAAEAEKAAVTPTAGSTPAAGATPAAAATTPAKAEAKTPAKTPAKEDKKPVKKK
jgi:large subunit ribosomal protein L11